MANTKSQSAIALLKNGPPFMRTARWEDSETVRLMLIASSTASRTELATDRPVNFLSLAPYGVESGESPQVKLTFFNASKNLRGNHPVIINKVSPAYRRDRDGGISGHGPSVTVTFCRLGQNPDSSAEESVSRTPDCRPSNQSVLRLQMLNCTSVI
ncbi:hypothetical protein P170DRAFT_440737 [Aspergillus steynii IBT 23096]|uniref:Uncharacterized protein n=1 Tax=Aspergillus steynii IBT 23096 TaxID=1392250 RepID=A0A2I2FUY1_9EURO|nr:uncharacterized protein P170DRAFT_440737 [Aspergillus steynii IBT 23096]PLB44458.1 hypothetical protein P170DRAFT_440737 [Aspergillus steynii IBT 23096]